MDEWHYKHRLARNEGRGVFCSVKCGHANVVITEEQRQKISVSLKRSYETGKRGQSESHIVKCATCGVEFSLKQWEYNSRQTGRGFFCSREHSLMGRTMSDEARKKSSQSQTGVSVPTRGRPGHIVTEETRKRISKSKAIANIGVLPDWQIVRRAAQDEGIKRYVVTQAPVPDVVFVEDGRLIAMEVEKKPHFTAVKKKMDAYSVNTNYDKVILRWYNLRGEFQKRWVFESGKWQES